MVHNYMTTSVTELAVQKSELFDVVDAEDTVLRTAERAVVHREQLMHRAVHVFVFNTAGHLYLQRRSLTKIRRLVNGSVLVLVTLIVARITMPPRRANWPKRSA